MMTSPTHLPARDEPVQVVPYDPSWTQRAAEEIARLRALLPEVGAIEHFGSTAVPELAAKPIIDLMVEVPSLEWVHEVAAPRLQAAGYEYFWRRNDLGTAPEYAWFLRRDETGRRVAHVHCFRAGSPLWQERLRFRDRLRADSRLREAYARLKRELARRHAHDRQRYAKEKSRFIESVLHETSGFT